MRICDKCRVEIVSEHKVQFTTVKMTDKDWKYEFCYDCYRKVHMVVREWLNETVNPR